MKLYWLGFRFLKMVVLISEMTVKYKMFKSHKYVSCNRMLSTCMVRAGIVGYCHMYTRKIHPKILQN